MEGYILTNHAWKRAQQRGYRKEDIRFVLVHGTQTDRGIFLARRDISRVAKRGPPTAAMAERLKGTLIATTGNVVKTIFRANRKQQSRLM